MKRYKKWIAAILTGILMSTGTVTPALAAGPAAGEEAAAEIVQAADFSDELEISPAEDPDAATPSEENNAPVEDNNAAEILTEEAESPENGTVIEELPEIEEEIVSANPAIPVKSMTMTGQEFLFFDSPEYSFSRSIEDADGNYLDDRVKLTIKTTLATDRFDDIWVEFEETDPKGDYAHAIQFLPDSLERDSNGVWILKLITDRDSIKSSGNYRLSKVFADIDGEEYVYKTAGELAPFRNCIDTIYVKTLQEFLDSLPQGTNAYFEYLKDYDGGSISIPEGITIGIDNIFECTTPLFVNGSIYAGLGKDGLLQLVFGGSGKLLLYYDLIQELPANTDIPNLLRHMEPYDKSEKLRFYPFGTGNASYVWNGSSWQNEGGLPGGDQITPITGRTSIPKDSKEHWYSYTAPKTGDYAFNLSFTSYQYETFVLESYLMDSYGNMTELSALYEDSYGDYFMDGVHLDKGTTIYLKAKNSGCTGAYLTIASYQPQAEWISTVLDFNNANTSVRYDKDRAFVTVEIPILDMTKWKTIDSFDLYYTDDEEFIRVSFDKEEVKNGKLILSQNEGTIVTALIPETLTYDKGMIGYWFAGPTAEDEGESHEVHFQTAGTNYAIPGDGLIIIPETFAVTMTTRKYVAGTLMADTPKTQPANTSYFYKVVIQPVYEVGDGYSIELEQDYSFSVSSSRAYLRLYTDTNREVGGSNGTFELKGGTYYLHVNNHADEQVTIRYIKNSSVTSVANVQLGQTAFASQEAIALTVTYSNTENYKLSEVELLLKDENNREYELKQYKVTSDNGRTFKSIVYLDRDEDVTANNLKIKRVYVQDIYGKRRTIFAEDETGTWMNRNHQLVTRDTRFRSSAATEQVVNFIELKGGDIVIPLFAVVNVYSGVSLDAPDSLKVYGTLGTPHLSLLGWGDPIEITVDGTIYAGQVDIQNFVLKGENKGHIIINGDIHDPYYQGSILSASENPTQEEVDSYIKMLRQVLTAETEGTPLLVAVVWSYYKWENGEWVYDFAALQGLTTSCGMQLNDKTFIYDGKYHSLEVENKSDEVRVTYENNYHKDPGVYVVTAHFRPPKGYDQENFYDLTAVMTIVKQEGNFTLSEKDGVNIPTLSTLQLTAKTESGGAYPSASSLVWSSSNTKVATVNSSGLVTGKTYGEAVITAKTPDGKIKAERKVKVVFNDVTRSNAKASVFTAVCWLADHKITGGYGGVTYGPLKNCTRQEFTIFMYRAANNPTVSGAMLAAMKFPDIDSCSATAKKAIAWAVDQGIIKGYSDGTFRPNDNITRDSMALMFYRAAGTPPVTDAQINALTFKDIAGCSANVKKAIAWAVSAGIVGGYTDGSGNFGPRDMSLRSQVAIMLYRFYK